MRESADVNALHRSDRGDAGHSLIHHAALRCVGVKVAAVVIFLETVAGPHAVVALLPGNFCCFKGAGVTTEYQNISLTSDCVACSDKLLRLLRSDCCELS